MNFLVTSTESRAKNKTKQQKRCFIILPQAFLGMVIVINMRSAHAFKFYSQSEQLIHQCPVLTAPGFFLHRESSRSVPVRFVHSCYSVAVNLPLTRQVFGVSSTIHLDDDWCVDHAAFDAVLRVNKECIIAGAYNQEPLSPIQALEVNPFPRGFINRMVPRGGFARRQ